MDGKLGESLNRLKRFEIELKEADPATLDQLLSAWKEQVIEDCASALRDLKDPQLISNIDRNIALVRDVVRRERLAAMIGKRS